MTTEPKSDGGPAFPRAGFWARDEAEDSDFQVNSQDGMSLRDWFAGIKQLTQQEQLWIEGGKATESQVRYAYADAMLAEREKR